MNNSSSSERRGSLHLQASECLSSLNRTLQDPSHQSSTPSCLLQSGTHKYLAAGVSSVNTSGVDVERGQIPVPRYDPHYAFRHKDGVCFDLEPFGGNRYFEYSGDWVESKRHGTGVIVLKDGSSVAGSLVDGELTGHGVHTWPDGSVYTGGLYKGEAHGEGEKIWASGGLAYRGEFRFGLLHGRGRWSRYRDEEIYEGEFANSKRHGTGTLTVKGKYHYDGTFQNNKFHGTGTLTSLDPQTPGKMYQGRFDSGEFHGMGVLSTPDSIVYQGMFTRGRRAEVAQSLLPAAVRIRELTVTNYIQGGVSPQSPYCPASLQRQDKEQFLLQDPYIQLYVGTPLSFTVCQSRLCPPEAPKKDPTMSTQKGSKGEKKGGGPVSMPKPKNPAAALSANLRDRHRVDDMCVMGSKSAMTSESGRMLRIGVLAVPPGEDAAFFSREEYEEAWQPFYLESTTNDEVTIALGDFFSTQKVASPGHPNSVGGKLAAPPTPQKGLTPINSKPNTSRQRPPPSPGDRALGSGATPLSPLSPNALSNEDIPLNCILSLKKPLKRGQASAVIRLAPTVPCGEYVIVSECLCTKTTCMRWGTNGEEAVEDCPIAELRIPIRVVPMDFQTQKACITAFQTGFVTVTLAAAPTTSVGDGDDAGDAAEGASLNGGDGDGGSPGASPVGRGSSFALRSDDGNDMDVALGDSMALSA